MLELTEGLAPGVGHNADGMLMIYMRVCIAVNAADTVATNRRGPVRQRRCKEDWW